MRTLSTASELTPLGRWTVVGLLSAALLINYVDRGAVPTAAHLIQDELGLSPKQLGVLFSAFFWTYSVLQIPVGWVAERYGAQRVLAAGLALWACATMLVGLAHSFAALLALRLLLGIGESAGFPSASKLLAAAVPVGSLATANGMLAAAYQFGPAVGAYCGGLIMAHYGWRAAFWAFGGLSLLWLIPWSQVRLPREMARSSAAGSPPFSRILRQPSLWGTALGLFSTNYAFYFILSWLPYYVVRERGFSTSEMAALAGSAYAVSAVTSIVAGWVIDRTVRRGHANIAYKSVMVVAHVGTVACMLGIAFASQPWAIAAIFTYQVITGAAAPGVFAIPQILAGPKAAARWVGIQNCCGNLAGVIAPAVTGFLVAETGHFGAAFVTAGLVSLAGLVGWVGMIPKLAPLAWHRVPAEPEGVSGDRAVPSASASGSR
ncbi:MAG TPA: MFS transporter [Steroidobacteraceae bacterium]|nr:MFS transporter [Steroidobacteraceae bacterium]